MHDYFADWYREVSLDPNEEELEKRWDGVRSFTRGRSKMIEGTIELNRLHCGLPVAYGEMRERFVSKLKEADSTFSLRNNERELQVLAGAAIADLIERRGTSIASAAALGSLCLSCEGLGPAVAVPDVEELASAALRKESQRRWGPARAPAIPKVSDMSAAISSMKEDCQNNDLTQMADPLADLFQRLELNVGNLRDAVRSAVQQLNGSIELQREESNVLWWLVGEYSRSFECRFKDLSSYEAPIAVGRELSASVKKLPGPGSYVGILLEGLGRAGVDPDEDILPSQCVEKCDTEYLKGWNAAWKCDGRLSNIGLVSWLVKRRLELKDAADWASGVEEGMGVPSDSSITVEEMALQVYREGLLAKVSES